METNEETKITIPVKYQELGKELANLATKYGLREMSATLKPSRFAGWDADVQFKWNQGRHDEDVGGFSLFSEMRQFVNMSWDEIKVAVEHRREQDRGKAK